MRILAERAIAWSGARAKSVTDFLDGRGTT